MRALGRFLQHHGQRVTPRMCMAALLCGVAAILWMNEWLGSARHASVKASSVGVTDAEVADASSSDTGQDISASWPTTIRHDPFAFHIKPEVAVVVINLPPDDSKTASLAASRLRVQAILFNNARSQAIINNTPVRLGDSIEGCRVVSIRPDRVIVACDGAEIQLLLRQGDSSSSSESERSTTP